LLPQTTDGAISMETGQVTTSMLSVSSLPAGFLPSPVISSVEKNIAKTVHNLLQTDGKFSPALSKFTHINRNKKNILKLVKIRLKFNQQ
jgi:hypothetical protein